MKTADIIPRPAYLDQLRPLTGKNIIKVLTGQRRVGKSFVLKSLAQEIHSSDSEANLITIDLENFAFSHITDAKALHDEIMSRISNYQRNYIFIDEIQEIDDFDKVIRSLNLDSRNDIYITGSNSKMLSSEVASRLAGRSIEIRVHPLAYPEFLLFHDLEESDMSLDLYLRYGGLPYLRNLPKHETWGEYIQGVVDAVVYRDVVSRNSLRNNDFLQRLLLFLADNIGQIFSAKKISDYLKSQRMSSSVASVQNHVHYISEAYIVNQARRWNLEGRRFFEIGEKYYFEDLGIRNSLVGLRPHDMAALVENAVYNHLRYKGYEVRIGVLSKGREINFIAEKNNERIYIQVALTVVDPQTAEREFGNLKLIDDNYRKIVVTWRESYPNTIDGIACISLREFLNSL